MLNYVKKLGHCTVSVSCYSFRSQGDLAHVQPKAEVALNCEGAFLDTLHDACLVDFCQPSN
jgi:hypothetical protein